MVLSGDNVTDDTGGYAVFTEQGASASHDSRKSTGYFFLSCWACHVRQTMRSLRILKSKCMMLQFAQRSGDGVSNILDQASSTSSSKHVPSGTQPSWPSIGRTAMGGKIGRKFSEQKSGRKYPAGSVFFLRPTQLFLSVHVEDV